MERNLLEKHVGPLSPFTFSLFSKTYRQRGWFPPEGAVMSVRPRKRPPILPIVHWQPRTIRSDSLILQEVIHFLRIQPVVKLRRVSSHSLFWVIHQASLKRETFNVEKVSLKKVERLKIHALKLSREDRTVTRVTDTDWPLWQSLDWTFVLGGRASVMTQPSLENVAIKHPLLFSWRSAPYCERNPIMMVEILLSE